MRSERMHVMYEVENAQLMESGRWIVGCNLAKRMVLPIYDSKYAFSTVMHTVA